MDPVEHSRFLRVVYTINSTKTGMAYNGTYSVVVYYQPGAIRYSPKTAGLSGIPGFEIWCLKRILELKKRAGLPVFRR